LRDKKREREGEIKRGIGRDKKRKRERGGEIKRERKREREI
jgi:hypothetical protein